VVGDGSDDNPRRLKVADYYGNHSAVLPDDGTWGIAVVAVQPQLQDLYPLR
jgi:hypothetical protein